MRSKQGQNLTLPRGHSVDFDFTIAEFFMGSSAFVYQGSLYMILAEILYFVDKKG